LQEECFTQAAVNGFLDLNSIYKKKNLLYNKTIFIHRTRFA